jgi:hypothetical protein
MAHFAKFSPFNSFGISKATLRKRQIAAQKHTFSAKQLLWNQQNRAPK